MSDRENLLNNLKIDRSAPPAAGGQQSSRLYLLAISVLIVGLFWWLFLSDDELKEGDIRLLSVDNRLVLPVNKNIHVLVTAGDVLHSFAMPSLGVKKDAVPGRLNETWMNIEKPGIYRGQCSELCGTGHGYMPIVIEAVSEEDFLAWAMDTKIRYAMNEKNTFAKANTK